MPALSYGDLRSNGPRGSRGGVRQKSNKDSRRPDKRKKDAISDSPGQIAFRRSQVFGSDA